MMEVTSYVDDREREFENIRKVLQVQEQFSGKFPWLAVPHRRFVKEGPVVDNNSAKQRYWFLFNDILVITRVKKEDKYHVLAAIFLADISISESPQNTSSNNCEIVLQILKGQSYKTHRFISPTPSSTISWKREIVLLQKNIAHSFASMDPNALIPSIPLHSPKKKDKEKKRSFRRSLSLTLSQSK